MKLKRDGKLIRYAYWPELKMNEFIPSTISLCAFMWRVCVGIPIATFIVGAFLTATAVIWVPVWAAKKIYEKAYFGEKANAFVDRKIQSFAAKRKNSIILAYMKALHEKACPMIELEDENVSDWDRKWKSD